MGADKSKKQPSPVKEHHTWGSEFGSAASMLCGLEEVTGSLWSASIQREENERVSRLMESSVSLDPMHLELLLNGTRVGLNSSL